MITSVWLGNKRGVGSVRYWPVSDGKLSGLKGVLPLKCLSRRGYPSPAEAPTKSGARTINPKKQMFQVVKLKRNWGMNVVSGVCINIVMCCTTTE